MTVFTPVDCGASFEGRDFGPGESFLLPDAMALDAEERITARGGRVRLSSSRNVERALRPADVRPGDVLVSWRGCAFGDQLVWAGLLAIVARLCPGLRIRHYSMNCALWQGVPHVPFEARPDPAPWTDWRAADWHISGEGLNEDDTEPDQPPIWDGHLRAAGIDPHTVPWSERLPLVPIAPADRAAADAFLSYHVRPDSRPLVFWQLSASAMVRSYPPEQTRAALDRLASTCHLIVSGTRRQIEAYKPLPLQAVVLCEPDIRTGFAVARQCDCIVAPDSVFSWAAVGLARPLVSLWASFLPGDRIGPYGAPITGPNLCGLSPCRKHEKPWLPVGCPIETGAGCRCIAAIPPEQIAAAVHKAVGRPVASCPAPQPSQVPEPQQKGP